MADRCRDCSVPVIWAVTLAGKRQPLNAAPDPVRGDTFIAAADHGARLAIHVSRLTEAGSHAAFSAGLRLYTSHFQTCSARRNGHQARKEAP